MNKSCTHDIVVTAYHSQSMEESHTPVTNVIARQNGSSMKGVHYCCDKCDHTSTHNSNLKRHVQSQH